MSYKTWKTALVVVQEVGFDYDLHAFDIYNHEDIKLGTVYPATVEDMETMIDELNNGACPIADCWEDGKGHSCHINGWGTEEE